MKIFEFRKYSTKELAALYGKSPRSFNTWIKSYKDQIGPKNGWDYTPAQVRIIVARIGRPPGYILPKSTEK
jgi:hypothetical protein